MHCATCVSTGLVRMGAVWHPSFIKPSLVFVVLCAAHATRSLGITCNFVQNTDVGPDFHVNVGRASTTDCCASCTSRSDCAAGVYAAGTCYLKLANCNATLCVVPDKHGAITCFPQRTSSMGGAVSPLPQLFPCNYTPGPMPSAPPCPPEPRPPSPPSPPPTHIWHDYRPTDYPVLPQWEPTWELARSTIVMPCRTAGLMTPVSVKGWGIVDFDVSVTHALTRLWSIPTPNHHVMARSHDRIVPALPFRKPHTVYLVITMKM